MTLAEWLLMPCAGVGGGAIGYVAFHNLGLKLEAVLRNGRKP